jgi:hypothetical protein
VRDRGADELDKVSLGAVLAMVAMALVALVRAIWGTP